MSHLTDDPYLQEMEALVVKLLTPLPAEFQAAGLQFIGTEDQETLKDRFIRTLNFQNQPACRLLCIVLNGNGISSVNVNRFENVQPHSPYFHDYDYLKFVGREREAEELLSNRSNPEKYIQFILKLMREDWMEILQGKKWIDVPDYLALALR